MANKPQFNPDLQLDTTDRANLAGLSSNEGFKVLQRIMRSEVDKFVVKLINTDPAKPKEIIAAHRLAKAAAQFYTAISNRVNEEIQTYIATPREGDRPVDVTSGVLDFGQIAAELSDTDFGGE